MIKNFLYSVLLLGIVTSCNNQNATSTTGTDTTVTETLVEGNNALGVISFEEDKYEFGIVKEGKVVEHVFKFTNTGTAPVILTQVSASCGCTTPEYTKDPILPGKAGEIKVSFDSKGQVGNQQKIVTVSSNAENSITTVEIKGIVEK